MKSYWYYNLCNSSISIDDVQWELGGYRYEGLVNSCEYSLGAWNGNRDLKEQYISLYHPNYNHLYMPDVLTDESTLDDKMDGKLETTNLLFKYYGHYKKLSDAVISTKGFEYVKCTDAIVSGVPAVVIKADVKLFGSMYYSM